jgi:hypothetical protein
MFRIGQVLNGVVDVVCDDLKKNTLTNIATVGTGIGIGARTANVASRTGFTMLERKVTQKTIAGGVVGGGIAYGNNQLCLGSNVGGKVLKLTDKVAQVEKWFDNTSVGARIDNEITYVQGLSHQAINKTFGM